MSDVRDREHDARATPVAAPHAQAAGSVARALLWLVAGIAALFVLAGLVAPELMAAPGEVGQLLILVLLAGLPGLILIVAVVRRRRRIDEREC